MSLRLIITPGRPVAPRPPGQLSFSAPLLKAAVDTGVTPLAAVFDDDGVASAAADPAIHGLARMIQAHFGGQIVRREDAEAVPDIAPVIARLALADGLLEDILHDPPTRRMYAEG